MSVPTLSSWVIVLMATRFQVFYTENTLTLFRTPKYFVEQVSGA